MDKKTILIKGGRVVDPANNLDGLHDILIGAGRIRKIEKKISQSADKIIEAKGKVVMPGLVDMHVHLREPGREDKETVSSGTQAALKGGVTSVLAMPNTNPAIDSPQEVKLLKEIIKRKSWAQVYIVGAITKKREGKKLNDISGLKKAGVIAISDDGSSVEDQELMKQALVQAKKNKLLVICHCEDKKLSKNGAVNLGFTSTCLGLPGISKESEYKRVARDIKSAKETKARIHIAHVSCKESVEIIAQAKKEKVSVSAETAPHYFSLTQKALHRFDTNLKMNPPLRSREDLASIKQGLKDGTIDVIASDHAPHTLNEKAIEFENAAFGVTGLETELAVTLTELVAGGLLDWPEVVKKLSYNPAEILNLQDKGRLKIGCLADMIIVSPDKEWTVNKEGLISKSKNSCFLGKKLKGVVEYTIYQGQIAYSNKDGICS